MSNYSVAGDWGDFEFKIIRRLDYPIVLEHIRSVFCKTAPVMTCLGYTVELGNDLCRSVEEELGLDSGNELSFMATHKSSKKLAGVRIMHSTDRDKVTPEFTFTSEAYRNATHNFIQLSKLANIFDRYNVDSYVKMSITSIHPEFRQQGLATEMYRRTLALLKARSFSVAECTFTSSFSRQIGIRFGFEEIIRRYFKAFEDMNGEKFITNAQDDQFAAVMALRL